MLLPVVILLFFIALYVIYDTNPSLVKDKYFCVYWGVIAFVLLQCLRIYCQNTFPDIPNYKHMFINIKPLTYVISNNGQGLDYYDSETLMQVDLGFRLFISIIKCISDSFGFFLFVISILELWTLKYFCNKFGISLFLIMPIYVALTYTAFQIGMLRQALACCIFFVALCHIQNKLYFLTLILAGCFMHKSMIFCFLFFWCDRFISIKYINLLFLLAIIIYLLRIDYIGAYWSILEIQDAGRVNHYLETGVEGSYLGIGFWERMILYVLMILSYNKLIAKHKERKIYILFFNLGISLILLQLFFFASPAITSRLRYYIVIFPLLFLLLYSREMISKKEIKLSLYLPIAVYLLMYIYTQSGYLRGL